MKWIYSILFSLFYLLSAKQGFGQKKVITKTPKILAQCPIPKSLKMQLINNSPYQVKDIKCTKNQSYRWIIEGHSKLNELVTIEKKASLKKDTHRTPAQATSMVPESMNKSIVKPIDRFKLGMIYGIQSFSNSQTGILGEIDIGSILTKATLFTSYTNKNFLITSKVESLDFNFIENNSNQSMQFLNYALKTGHQNFFIEAQIGQSPLLKNTTTGVEVTVEEMTFAKIGYHWDINLNSNVKTNLFIDLAYTHLITGKASDTSIFAKNYKGRGAEMNATFIRNLQLKQSPLKYYWSNSISTQSIERDIQWGTSDGRTKSTNLQIGSSIGIQLEF